MKRSCLDYSLIRGSAYNALNSSNFRNPNFNQSLSSTMPVFPSQRFSSMLFPSSYFNQTQGFSSVPVYPPEGYFNDVVMRSPARSPSVVSLYQPPPSRRRAPSTSSIRSSSQAPRQELLNFANSSLVCRENNSGMVLALPLAQMSPRTLQRTVQNVSQSRIQIPVSVELPPGFMEGNNLRTVPRPPPSGLLGGIEQNPLLTPNQPVIYTPLGYLPRKAKKRIAQDEDDDKRRKTPVGINKWFAHRRWTKQEEQRLLNKRVRAVNRGLKRLQSAYNKRVWKSDKKLRFSDTEEQRDARRRILERKGFKKPLPVECPLYCCPRKDYKRRRPFRTIRHIKSPSILSLSPGRSRSPIVIGQQLKRNAI